MTEDMQPTTERWLLIEEIFSAAIEADRSQRSALIAELVGADIELQAEIECMVEAHECEASKFEQRQLGLGEVPELEGHEVDLPDPLLGHTLGSYRVERIIGEGGMGRVYCGRRIDGVHDQMVAIKVVRPLRSTSETRERFRLERAVLAHLAHPNIATMLDGGVSADGVPYLVMEYVEGQPLLEYCDQRRLEVRERIELLGVVCDAVEFAHSHLVIHRDLKSSNILVTADGDIKLLDFGIAKLLDPQLLDITINETRADARIATPLHAAPEQLLGGPLTTATDVYSLGVLLFELLCGRLPYQLETGTHAELERAVVALPPLRPSRALSRAQVQDGSDMPETTELVAAADVADLRGSTLARLSRDLRGDLEHITLRALRKEEDRRYSSAGRLGEDLRRYLDGMPVTAHLDSLGYRVTRFVGRHRIGVAVAVLVLLGLIATSLFTTFQSRRFERERDRSAVLAQTMIDLVEGSLPGEAQGDSISVTDFIERMERKIDELESQPTEQVSLLRVLGRIYRSRGRPQEGLAVFERELEVWIALGREDDEGAVELLFEIARATHQAGNAELAEQRYRHTLQRFKERFGATDRRVLLPMNDLTQFLPPAEALVHVEGLLELLRKRQRPDEKSSEIDVASALNRLGIAYRTLGQRAAAQRHFADAVEIVSRHLEPKRPIMLTLRNNLASTLDLNPETQLDTLQQVLEDRISVQGEDSRAVALTRMTLASKLVLHGRSEQAVAHFDRAEVVLRGAVQSDDSSLGQLAAQRAHAHRALNDVDRERADLDTALGILEGAEWAQVAGDIALLMAADGDLDQAMALSNESLAWLPSGSLVESKEDWRAARCLLLSHMVHIVAGNIEQSSALVERFESLSAWTDPPRWFGPSAQLARAIQSAVAAPVSNRHNGDLAAALNVYTEMPDHDRRLVASARWAVTNR